MTTPSRELIYYDNPLLRKRCTAIQTIDSEVKEIVADLKRIIGEYPAWGLAGPQIGALYRIFYASIDEYRADGSVIPGHRKIYINPVLSDPRGEKTIVDEGCLSLPKLRVPVERPQFITVKALDENGEPFEEELEDIYARVIMHENDHLNGVLTIDRLSKHTRQRYNPELKAIKKLYGSS